MQFLYALLNEMNSVSKFTNDLIFTNTSIEKPNFKKIIEFVLFSYLQVDTQAQQLQILTLSYLLVFEDLLILSFFLI